MGLDEYETRTSAGWLYPRYPVPVGRCFSVEPATGLGGNVSRITRPQVYRVVRENCPGRFRAG